MRTTVTLDPDTLALLRKRMKERGLSFKQAVNEAIRAGLVTRSETPNFRTPTFDMGPPVANLDSALRLAAEFEDSELRRKMQVGK